MELLKYNFKGNINNIIYYLNLCPKRGISELLIKFFNHIKNDVYMKYGAIKCILICECFIGKNSVVNKTKFSARGRTINIKYLKSNISFNVFIIG